MHSGVRVYPYGFLFTEEQTENLPAYYNNKNILDKYFYYYDNQLKEFIVEKNGRFLIIHGEFIHIGINNMFSKTKLLNELFVLYEENYDAFLDTLDFISGRFVIIVGNCEKVEVYPDATNSRSAFFLENKHTIASHAHILNDCFNLKERNLSETLKNILLNTPYEKVGSTISNYSLTLGTNNFKRYFPRENNKYAYLTENQKFELIEKFWKEQLNIAFKKSNNVILSLTGGGDSRTSLALIKEHLEKVKLFTYATTDGLDETNSSTKGLSMDNSIVKKMVENLKLNHKFFYFDKEDKTLTEEEYRAITKNSIAMHSRFFIAYLRKNYDLTNLTHIRANLLEIGQAYIGRHKNKPDSIETALEAFKNRFRSDIKNENDEKVMEEMFFDYIDKTNFGENFYNYKILDLFYWEVFMGRWYPEVLNTHDIICETVSPYNHRALIDITLAFPFQKRRERYFQYELVNRNFPVLNFFGLNNNKNLYEQKKHNNLSVINKTKRNKLFKVFQMVEGKQEKSIACDHNVLYIPQEQLLKGNYSEVRFRFSKDNGIVHLAIKSRFTSKEFKNFMQYGIYINDEHLLKEDVSNWSIPNYVSIKGVQKDDLIKVRVTVKKDIEMNSYWEDATKIEIMEYREISSKMTGENSKVNFSSPYSIQLN